MINISASIVLFNNDKKQIKQAIDSFFSTNLKVKLYLVDNSANDSLRELANIDDKIDYIFNNANLGYGNAHNVAIKKSIDDNIPYHIVLNPDIYFREGVIEELLDYMQQNTDVGNIMPQIIYPDGQIQYLNKLVPTPIDLIFRRFIPFKKYKQNINERYELRFTGYNTIANIPILSGCFMFLRVDCLKDVGLFDENIFMYLEDVDLGRRIHRKYKTIFYPNVSVTHEYAKESYTNKKLLVYHIKSAIYYFNKYGWFFDKERREINKHCLNSLGFKKNV